MIQRKNKWTPEIGAVVTYVGRNSRLTKGSYNVRIVAETSTTRMLVEAIGKEGQPIRFSVKSENLAPLQPTLFD